MSGRLEKAGLALSAYSGMSNLIRDFFSGRTAWANVSNAERDATLFFLNYKNLQARLLLWCERAGFALSQQNGTYTFVPAQGRRIETNALFWNPKSQEIVQTVFSALSIVLKEIDEQFVTVRPSLDNLSVAPSVASPSVAPTGLPEKLPIEIIAEAHQQILRNISARPQSLEMSTRLSALFTDPQWAKKVDSVLGQLREQIGTLESHLSSEQHAVIQELTPSLALAGESNQDFLGGLIDVPVQVWPQLVIAAANRYQSFASSQAAATPAVPAHLRRTECEFVPSAGSKPRERGLVLVNGVRCIVEWKRAAISDTREEIRVEGLLDRLVRMLQIRHPREYLVLQARGFIKDESEISGTSHPRIWFGIVYHFPDASSISGAPTSLHSILESDSFSIPALGERFDLARKLARSLLLFHTSGWLHQSLRPDNVLFFTRGQSQTGPDLQHPHFSGFEYTRGPTDISETRAADELLHDVYQHPSRRKHSPQNVVPYRQEFDIYSFGCILCTIGQWRTIEDVLDLSADGTVLDESEWQDALLENIDSLPPNVGDIFTNVIKWCMGFSDGPIRHLQPPVIQVQSSRFVGRDKDLALGFLENVVVQLEKCRA